MILFVSPYQTAPDCVALIESATHTSVKSVGSIRLALAALRNHEFTAVVVDENLLEVSPGSADSLTQRLGGAIPVFLDMSCLRPERVAKFVSAAYRRREVEYGVAREQAIAELHSELKSELTGLLISSKMALENSGLSTKANEQLSAVLEIAQRIKQRLEPAD